MLKAYVTFLFLLHSTNCLADTYELNTGITIYKRMTAFEHEQSTDAAFTMDGPAKPRPWLSISLGDQYFAQSNWGYTVGLSYYTHHAHQQTIERNGKITSVNLDTRSRTEVLAIKPALFYRFNLPRAYSLKIGLGMTLGYTRIRGSAYHTESRNSPACYQAASQYLRQTNGHSKNLIYQHCDRAYYNREGSALGFQTFVAYERQHWRWELAVAIYNQTHAQDDYRFSAKELSFGVARRWFF